jgi:hypothetical protein
MDGGRTHTSARFFRLDLMIISRTTLHVSPRQRGKRSDKPTVGNNGKGPSCICNSRQVDYDPISVIAGIRLRQAAYCIVLAPGWVIPFDVKLQTWCENL